MTTSEAQTPQTPLTRARQRDVDRRRQRVHQALTAMRTDGSQLTVSAVATRAKVHRSFIHRHTDLHAAVLTAAADTTVAPAPASTAISHQSVLAENANLHQQNRRLAGHIRHLEDRLSDLLSQQAFERSGLGAPVSTAALQANLDAQQQANREIERTLAEREEELAAARETVRRLMNQLNRG